MSHTAIYNVWREMRQRCENPNNKYYHSYGARDIKVCDEWMYDFVAFNNWAQSSGYVKGLTIDRINNDKNYEPDNCRWADMKYQSNNTRRNVIIILNGISKTIAEWADYFGIEYCTFRYRYKRGIRGDKLIYKGSLKTF
jgi:hypothetical protein